MKQTTVLKLEASPAQFQAMLETMEAFNRACQFVADVAYEKRSANKIALQPLVYADLRKQFGLSSQMVVRCISKACEAYKADKRVHVRFDLHDPMIFDQRILSVKSLTHVSMLCISGRQLVAFRFHRYQAARSDRVKGQADLVLQQDLFYLHVCVDLPSPPPESAGIAPMTSARFPAASSISATIEPNTVPGILPTRVAARRTLRSSSLQKNNLENESID